MRRRVLATALMTALVLAVPAAARADQPADLQSQVDAAAQRIAAARVKADASSSAFFAAESALDQLDRGIEQLGADVDQRRASLVALRGDLQSFAIDRYMSGGATDTSSVFNAHDVNQAVAKSALSDILGDHKVGAITQIKDAQAALDAKLTDLRGQRATAQKATEDLAAQNAKLAKDVAALQAEYDRLDLILKDVQAQERQRLLAQVRQRAAAEAAAKAAAREQKAGADAAARKADAAGQVIPAPPWLCPVPSGASFTDTYGQPRSGGRRHLGVDMLAPTGTPTVAMVSGTVSYGRDSEGGLSWYLGGDDGNWYYGTHLSRFGPHDGRVTAGDVIGYIGQTGNASTPHLHLEIHIGGRGNVVDPYPAVATYC